MPRAPHRNPNRQTSQKLSLDDLEFPDKTMKKESGQSLLSGCKAASVADSRAAVTRAFRELRQCGIAEASAFGCAATLYRIHHPKVSDREARFAVADWLE